MNIKSGKSPQNTSRRPKLMFVVMKITALRMTMTMIMMKMMMTQVSRLEMSREKVMRT